MQAPGGDGGLPRGHVPSEEDHKVKEAQQDGAETGRCASCLGLTEEGRDSKGQVHHR